VPTLTVKNIPDELYERLKRSAAEHRRSLNSEILVCLDRALHSERVDPQAVLARADALRRRAALAPVTEELLREARLRMAVPPTDDGPPDASAPSESPPPAAPPARDA
jgi:plasmid stability protein